MEKINLNEYLASNEYPGRGIAVAMAPDGRQMFIGYFIMARGKAVTRNWISAKTTRKLLRLRTEYAKLVISPSGEGEPL